MATEAYRIEVHTLTDPAACGYEPCRSQPWVNEACPLSGDGSDIACATEAGGPGAYASVEDALPAPMPPEVEHIEVALLLVVTLVVGVGLCALGWSLWSGRKGR